LKGENTLLNNVTVFDFETTGLSAENDRIIEVAAIRCINGEIVSTFSTLVKFDGELSQKITEITGLTSSDLVGGLDEDPAFRILSRFIGDSTLVAHNAGFDLGFLHHGLTRLAGRTFSNPFIDTLTISRDRYTYPHKLENMCSRLGIELNGAHRALNDVIGCWELLKKLHADDSVDRYVNKLGYLSKFGPPNWYPKHASIFPTENKYEPRRA
jgi:DNA polymerase-3 subunit epsilon